VWAIAQDYNFKQYAKKIEFLNFLKEKVLSKKYEPQINNTINNLKWNHIFYKYGAKEIMAYLNEHSSWIDLVDLVNDMATLSTIALKKANEIMGK